MSPDPHVDGPAAPRGEGTGDGSTYLAAQDTPDGTSANNPKDAKKEQRGGWWSALKETVVVAVLALFFAFLIKTFLVQAFFIPSGSMENTLEEGDRLLVSKLSPTPFGIERGEIIVFQDPGQWLGPSTQEKSALYRAGQFVGVLPGDGDEYLIDPGIPMSDQSIAVRALAPPGVKELEVRTGRGETFALSAPFTRRIPAERGEGGRDVGADLVGNGCGRRTGGA